MKTENRIQHPELEREARQILKDLAIYCVEAGAPRCYQNWTPETLRDYLDFHCVHGSFSFVRAFGRIAGCGVVWQLNETELLERGGPGQNLFNWTPTNPTGDSLFIADFVCTAPLALEVLMTEFARRFPNWRTLKLFTCRRKRLVRLSPAQILRRFHLKRRPSHVQR